MCNFFKYYIFLILEVPFGLFLYIFHFFLVFYYFLIHMKQILVAILKSLSINSIKVFLSIFASIDFSPDYLQYFLSSLYAL